MGKDYVRLRNDFHDTETDLRLPALRAAGGLREYGASARQMERAGRVLCGISGCTCGGAFRDSRYEFEARGPGFWVIRQRG